MNARVVTALVVCFASLAADLKTVEPSLLQASDVEAQAAAPKWSPADPGDGWAALMQGDRQLGAFKQETGEVWRLDHATGNWIRERDRAFCREDAWQQLWLAHQPGLDWRKLQREVPGYRIGPRTVTQAEAMTALRPSPTLPDDAALPSLTIIGSEADCKPVMDAITNHKELSPLRSLFLLQCYRPTDAMVSKYGFVTTGSPTVYFQDPAGRVLFRADRHLGAEALAEAIKAGLEQCPAPPRKPQPNYDPARDPDPSRLVRPLVQPNWTAWALGGICLLVTTAVLVVGAFAGGVIVTRRRAPLATPAEPKSGNAGT